MAGLVSPKHAAHSARVRSGFARLVSEATGSSKGRLKPMVVRYWTRRCCTSPASSESSESCEQTRMTRKSSRARLADLDRAADSVRTCTSDASALLSIRLSKGNHAPDGLRQRGNTSARPSARAIPTALRTHAMKSVSSDGDTRSILGVLAALSTTTEALVACSSVGIGTGHWHRHASV